MERQKYRPIILGDTASLILKDAQGMPVLDAFGRTQLDEKEWLRWRDHGPDGSIKWALGGSNAASVFNLSPWTCALDLYNQKKGIGTAVTRTFNNESKEGGHIFEPYVAELFAAAMKKAGHTIKIINDTRMFQCGRLQLNKNGDIIEDENGLPKLAYPFALADLDRICIIDGQMCILEIKTTSSMNREMVENAKNLIPPIYYEYQVRHYMAVMNIDHAYIIIAWGFTASDCAIIPVERDMDLEEMIMEEEKHFVKMLEEGTPPDMRDVKADVALKYYGLLYGEVYDTLPPIEIPGRYKPQIDRLLQAEEQLGKLEERKKQLEEIKNISMKELMPLFENAACGIFRLGDGRTAWLNVKCSHTRPSVDAVRLKQDHPDIYNECMDFSAPMLRKKHAEIYAQYRDKPQVKGERSFKISVRQAKD